VRQRRKWVRVAKDTVFKGDCRKIDRRAVGIRYPPVDDDEISGHIERTTPPLFRAEVQ
jgi:hypothetical protein